MSGNVAAADANGCGSGNYAVQQLSRRVAACADRLDALLGRFHNVQMFEWESPAGRAYRVSVGLQAAALRRAREGLDLATAAVSRHSQVVSPSSGRIPGGGS